MNCRRVEKLIPLYVEGDLSTGIADRLTSHLEWCSRCNWLADDYKESQSWLRSAETPVFDEPFFADLKRDVLKQVSNANGRRSLLASFARGTQRWNRRQVLTLCASAVIILGVFVFYLYQTRTHSGRERIEEVTQAQNQGNDPTPAKSPVATGLAPEANPRERHPGPKHHRSARRDLDDLLSSRTAEPSRRDKTGDNGTEGGLSISNDPSDSRDMLRIELQTSDPNIRIIWFTPKETDSHQNKPATD
jgi:hypothetical protein